MMQVGYEQGIGSDPFPELLSRGKGIAGRRPGNSSGGIFQ
jgi:hypothetical protein